jgi:hypothetical protein
MKYEVALEILKDNETLALEYGKVLGQIANTKGIQWYDVDMNEVKVQCKKLDSYNELVWQAYELDCVMCE